MARLTYGEMRTRAERIADEEITKKVLAGLEALQNEYGDGWVEKIDCKILDLRVGSHCVLGQVCGSYVEGLEELAGGRDEKWAAAHGFEVSEDPDAAFSYRRNNEAWDALDEAWHIVLCDQT